MTQEAMTVRTLPAKPKAALPADQTAGERAALWFHRIVILLAFVMVFFPPFNPGRFSAKISGNTVEAGGLSATLYKGIMTSGVYALQIVDDPIEEEEEGTSGLKGTVWTYNNTGHPADIPIAYIFNGKDSFVRISGLYAGTVSDSRISPIIFDIASGTYNESSGTLTLTVGENKESCPISGSSFTLSERTFSKLYY